MRPASVFVVCLITAGFVALAARNSAGRKPLNTPEPEPGLSNDARGKNPGEDPDAPRRKLLWQIAQADTIAEELIDGRTRLADAADRLMEINQNRSESQVPGLRIFFNRPAAEPRELFARYALGKVRNQLRKNPARVAEACPRLNAEFRVLVGTDEQPLPTDPSALPEVDQLPPETYALPAPNLPGETGHPM
jgi:hypothetical protein